MNAEPSIDTTNDADHPAMLIINEARNRRTIIYMTLDDLDRLMLDGEATRRAILEHQ
jgi:hypothetical protein